MQKTEKTKTKIEKVETGGTNKTKTKSTKLTVTTKRLITGGIFSIGIIVAAGWAFGGVDPKDALIVISSVITGGFALLRL